MGEPTIRGPLARARKGRLANPASVTKAWKWMEVLIVLTKTQLEASEAPGTSPIWCSLSLKEKSGAFLEPTACQLASPDDLPCLRGW